MADVEAIERDIEESINVCLAGVTSPIQFCKALPELEPLEETDEPKGMRRFGFGVILNTDELETATIHQQHIDELNDNLKKLAGMCPAGVMVCVSHQDLGNGSFQFDAVFHRI